MEGKPDKWHEWLTTGRDAADSELRRRSMTMLQSVRDDVLMLAEIGPDDVVLDVGTGEGLLGLGALELIGDKGRVVFSDISKSLLDGIRAELDPEDDRADFVVTPAEELHGVSSSSVNVIVMRSVLIYIVDRREAFESFARVLRPGGRLSICEPVAAMFARARDERGTFYGYALPEAPELADCVREAYTELHPKDDPMMSLSAAELIEHAETAGFDRIAVHLRARSTRATPRDEAGVRRMIDGQPNPNAPSPGEMARTVLTASQAAHFIRTLSNAVREGNGRNRQAVLHLSGMRE